MKIRVADYIANFFVDRGVNHVFTVVGGGAMHLNDALGHNANLHCVYHHHEQAAAIAAEAFARINNKLAITCVTSGPGAINALNGVVGAYQDSIPMIVLSGQVKTSLTMRCNNLNLRTFGPQEMDIVPCLKNMVKYAEMITDAKKIRYYLEKAYYIATEGRMGPCWLDIPLDIQGTIVDTEELEGYIVEKKENVCNLSSDIDTIIEKIKSVERPVIYAGNGVRLSGGVNILHQLAKKFMIPIVTCWDSIDLIESENDFYCGRAGTMGDRAGNFAVQNSDLLICIGTRLNIYQVGYDVNTWARAAYTVVVDIDKDELTKPTIRVDLPICADACDFMNQLLKQGGNISLSNKERWLTQCVKWKKEYPVVQKRQYEEKDKANVYAFIDTLSRSLPEKTITVVTNGSASVVGSQTYYINKGCRFVMNCGLSSMGYGLPASIGACIADNKQKVICIEGDGSIMMNLQELQTITTNKLPIKLFIINNNGYHQIRQSQNNIFHNGLVGVGPDSGDLGFPNFKKIAEAFGIAYISISNNKELQEKIDETISTNEAVLCEVFVSITQIFEPKSATKKLPDGKFVSPPLEDLAPFLSREELEKNMYIPLLPEG